jgi:hypothetical protein
MDLTPELVESLGKASAGVIIAVGGILTTVLTTVTGYFTWKTRYELDRLYAKTYRPEADGTPGKMRKHPKALVKMFSRAPAADERKKELANDSDTLQK